MQLLQGTIVCLLVLVTLLGVFDYNSWSIHKLQTSCSSWLTSYVMSLSYLAPLSHADFNKLTNKWATVAVVEGHDDSVTNTNGKKNTYNNRAGMKDVNEQRQTIVHHNKKQQSSRFSDTAGAARQAQKDDSSATAVAAAAAQTTLLHMGSEEAVLTDDNSERRRGLASRSSARIAYLIMAAGEADFPRVKKLFTALYDPANFYVVHFDRKTSLQAVDAVRTFLEPYSNAKLLEPAMIVSWGGISITLTAVFGMAAAMQMSPDWDYFINLSASDFPILSQKSIGTLFGITKDRSISFIFGDPIDENSWTKRLNGYVDEQYIYRDQATKNPFWLLGSGERGSNPNFIRRKTPDKFQVFKGEFWVVAHRSFVRRIIESPDNVARSLLSYFSKYRVSDESYFQTTACHPNAPFNALYHGDHFRFINWPEIIPGVAHNHPDDIGPEHLPKIFESGAILARKFATSATSYNAIKMIQESLEDPIADNKRLALAIERITPALNAQDKFHFCNASGLLTNIGKYGDQHWPGRR